MKGYLLSAAHRQRAANGGVGREIKKTGSMKSPIRFLVLVVPEPYRSDREPQGYDDA